MASDPAASPRPLPRRSAVRRCAVLIALAAVMPAWLFRSILLMAVLRTGDSSPWALIVSGQALLLPALSLLFCFAVVLLLDHRDRFRADRWWLAGGLFVVAVDAATLVVEAPTVGEGAFVDLSLSLLAGPSVITFAAGAIVWRRLTPTYPPIDWLRPEDPFDE